MWEFLGIWCHFSRIWEFLDLIPLFEIFPRFFWDVKKVLNKNLPSLQLLPEWSSENGLTDGVLFLFDSFHSIASSACFLFLELAINPDIQAKLYAEIESTKKHLNADSFTHETLSKMEYLDAVVAEVFRRWCPMPQLQRTCIRPVTIEDSNGNRVQLIVGDTVVIPSYAIHMDDAYYRNPEKFDPERFNRTNRQAIRPDAYLPFGEESSEFHLASSTKM